MELQQYWKVIRKSLWIILLIAALGVGWATYYTLDQPTRYQSSTTLLLNPAVPSELVPYVQTQVAANLADSYTQLMHTRSFGDSVSKKLPFPMGAGAVPGAISTRLEENTLFYRITVVSDSPEHAQQLASAVVEVFLSSNASQQAKSSNDPTNPSTQMRMRMEDKLKYLGDQIASYQKEIAGLEAQPPSSEREQQILELRGQLVTLQGTETETMLAIAQLPDGTRRANTALLIDEALPGSPVTNRLTTNLTLALAASLLIGVGLAFLRNYLDYSVRTPEYLEELLHAAPVATVSMLGRSGGRAYGQVRGRSRRRERLGKEALGAMAGKGLVVLEDPRSPESESFRSLRTNIQFSNVDKPVRTLVVTSSSPQEGKTFTASNLAIVMAQAGKRVILVDADLRKPSLHRLFDLPNQKGFTNLIATGAVDDDAQLPTIAAVESLRVITSGPLPPNPSELLNSHQCEKVMERLASMCDLVIYDSPPAAAVTDPVILAARVDAVVLVIGAGATRRDLIVRVKQSLEKVAAGAVLTVLNRVKGPDLQGGYYYYRSYGGDEPRTRRTEHATAVARHTSNGKGPSNGHAALPASANGHKPGAVDAHEIEVVPRGGQDAQKEGDT